MSTSLKIYRTKELKEREKNAHRIFGVYDHDEKKIRKVLDPRNKLKGRKLGKYQVRARSKLKLQSKQHDLNEEWQGEGHTELHTK